MDPETVPSRNSTGARLPVGTVTFLLTDVEGSAADWESDHWAMAAAITRHYEILHAAISAHGGVRPLEQGEGDSVVAAFVLASDALRAAVDVQLALAQPNRGPGVVGWTSERPCTPARQSCATPGMSERSELIMGTTWVAG